MMMFVRAWSISLCLAFFIICTASDSVEKVNYSRHRVIRVTPSSAPQFSVLDNLSDTQHLHKQVRLWSDVPMTEGAVDIHVSDLVYENFTGLLNRSSISYQVLINDLQALIDKQTREMERHNVAKERLARRRLRRSTKVKASNSKQKSSGSPTLKSSGRPTGSAKVHSEQLANGDKVTEADIQSIIDNYASYDEIVDWLHVVKQYRPELVQIEILTKSTEGLPLYLIRIGRQRTDGAIKPAVWIDAGIHAREWIAPATAVYFIYSLVSGYGKDARVTKLVDEFDWFILPLLNPDGYEYSRTTDRMWRKTRSRTTNAKECQGVDGNRNFDFQWRGDCKPGRTCRGRNPCDDVFAGPKPFSEPETLGLANWIMANRFRLKVYIALHSYSQFWLTPWGYTPVHPADYSDLMNVSRKAVDALQSVYNTQYKIGSPAEILYIAAGGSYDWVKAVAGIKYVYTVELRDTGAYGFLLPRSQILPTGKETWAGVIKLVEEIEKDSCWMVRKNCW